MAVLMGGGCMVQKYRSLVTKITAVNLKSFQPTSSGLMIITLLNCVCRQTEDPVDSDRSAEETDPQ